MISRQSKKIDEILSRAIVGSVLVLIMLFFAWLDNQLLWNLLIAVVVLQASFEWARMIGYSPYNRYVYVLCLLSLLVIAQLIYVFDWREYSSLFSILVGVWILICASLPLVRRYSGLVLSIGGLLLLSIFWLAAVTLYSYGSNYAIYIIFMVAIFDISCFFCGRKFGKHKLAPAISPGKTIEGLVGGMLIGIAIFWVLYLSEIFQWSSTQLPIIVLLAVQILFFTLAVTGDLFISKIKRQFAIKDSGNLLLAHGGVLDRVDALLPCLPFAASLLGVA